MPLNHDELKSAARLACDWLVDVAQVPTRELTVEKNSMRHPYADWRGAIRRRVPARPRASGNFFCPVWHTRPGGQGAVGCGPIVWASRGTGRPPRPAPHSSSTSRCGTRLAGPRPHSRLRGLGRVRPTPPPCSSAWTDCSCSLTRTARRTCSSDWLRAGEFLVGKLYMPDEGLFHDAYDPNRHAVVLPNPFRTRNNVGGRPLLDDGIFLKLFRATGEPRFRDVHVRVSETLVQTQRPRGNWVDYAPCNPDRMRFHPRHTYWWGLPLLDTYRETGPARVPRDRGGGWRVRVPRPAQRRRLFPRRQCRAGRVRQHRLVRTRDIRGRLWRAAALGTAPRDR